MDASMNVLKPCPFCGSKQVGIVTLQHPRYAESYAVECLDCGVMTWPTISDEMAAKVWNRRKDKTDG